MIPSVSWRACLVLGAAALLAAVAAVFATLSNEDPGDAWWDHVEVLAADRMEGRFTGTRGYQRAANYVADRFRAYGLKPGGTDGTWFQPVTLTSQRVVAERSSLALVEGGVPTPLRIGPDVIIDNRIALTAAADAPLVFIGYGLHLPEAGWDDFGGPNPEKLDLRGKILVSLNGGPGTLSAALKSHSRAAETWKAVERTGALGLITIPNPKSMDIPWARQMRLYVPPGLYPADPALRPAKAPVFSGQFNPAEAEKLFAGTGYSLAELLALADKAQPLPRFALNKSLRAEIAVETNQVTAPNVAGVLPGSDPKLANEYVVLTAHLDGLGIGEPIDGDALHNGAMDNASGVATLLETARAMGADKARPKRPIVFLAVTGEEKGLLGSQAFAVKPTLPAGGRIVADLNTDMFLPLWPMTSLIIHGVDESELGADARAVAEAQGLAIAPDPVPDRNSFIRSDQYSFIRLGIPALSLKNGYLKDSPEAAIQKAWLTSRYHAPSDDLDQPVDRGAAVRMNAYLLALARRVADRPVAADWLPESFFRRFRREGGS